ncbi:acyl-CoA dehydrogenase [Amycolatopsis sp. WAC 04182]|uniref:acyl-CoA dehydrogenase family protein n=1 Tax=Amycolatopsis sp. WAC 04182 TaxID=2203198 RepID=UPI000F780A7D|nr:acyl-CoA dehydrogenase family protein [Amycolatopsis sp. WAC 04182]RSN60506.1 acyl-CoA dehydrogenase [Amycolatopsis sp. WAC 04182]
MTHPFAPPDHEQHWIAAAAELAHEFAKSAAERDSTGALPVENLRALHGAGIDAALVPTAFGGQGLSYRSYGTIVRTLSAACPSTACIWVMHIGAAIGLIEMSSPDMAKFWADELIGGARFANALSEPSSGNLFLQPLQHAEPADGGYRLSGAKRFSSGCEVADHFLVNALVDDRPTFFGLDTDPTMTFVPIWDTMGLRASRSQLIEFAGTLLPEDRRCPPSTGPRPNHIGAGLPFLSLGIADAALTTLTIHARTRTIPTTGDPLAGMQWVRFAVGDVASRLEAAAMYAQHMTWLADQIDPGFLPATMHAKLLANSIARDVADLGVRVGGGSGYIRGDTERAFRDAQAGWLMAYSGEICQDTIGASILSPTPQDGHHG